MTQSVTFHFTSSQFVLESGSVWFTKGARLFSEAEFQIGHIKDGSIDGVLVEGPIEFDAMLGDLTVVRSEDHRRYHVGPIRVTGDLRPEDLHSGRVFVRLNLPVILTVKVVDAAGHPVPDVTVSLHLPNWEATPEVQTDALGEIALLASGGKYSARVVWAQNRSLNVSADLTLMPTDSGERIVLLRLPDP